MALDDGELVFDRRSAVEKYRTFAVEAEITTVNVAKGFCKFKTTFPREVLALMIAATSIIVVSIALAQPSASYLPASAYHPRDLRGFVLLVNPEILKHPEDAAAMFEELESQLKRIEQTVPKAALAELKKVRFWIEWEAKPGGAAEFHVSETWLKDNGYNPEKALNVEINNCRNFVTWSQDGQPWMVLHELAHAYHHRVLKHKHEGLEAAFNDAVEKKRYESVAYFRPGEKRKAYAVTNVDEYFAELSEAYFGRNDFYPFDRADLARHDPAGYKAMREIWSR